MIRIIMQALFEFKPELLVYTIDFCLTRNICF